MQALFHKMGLSAVEMMKVEGASGGLWMASVLGLASVSASPPRYPCSLPTDCIPAWAAI